MTGALTGKGRLHPMAAHTSFEIPTQALAAVPLSQRDSQVHHLKDTRHKGIPRNLNESLSWLHSFQYIFGPRSKTKIGHIWWSVWKQFMLIKAAAEVHPKCGMMWRTGRHVHYTVWQAACRMVKFMHMVAWRSHSCLLQHNGINKHSAFETPFNKTQFLSWILFSFPNLLFKKFSIKCTPTKMGNLGNPEELNHYEV